MVAVTNSRAADKTVRLHFMTALQVTAMVRRNRG
jgi:hypothetical protein